MLANRKTGKVLFKKIILRRNLWEKATGLMFRDISSEECMLFSFKKQRKISIHMLFVFYPIDIVFLDNWRVVEIAENVKPWSFYTAKRKADAFVEFKHKDIGVEVGDVLEIIEG